MILVSRPGTKFAIAYTGQARIGRTNTDEWLVQQLTELNRPLPDVPAVAQRLEDELTAALGRAAAEPVNASETLLGIN